MYKCKRKASKKSVVAAEPSSNHHNNVVHTYIYNIYMYIYIYFKVTFIATVNYIIYILVHPKDKFIKIKDKKKRDKKKNE